MKIDRLISIIMVLLERDKVSATKLAEMFEVTPRTIYRDIETIQLAGIPVTAQPGINGGISIMPRYKVDKKLFTTADIMSLLRGLDSISSTLASKELANTQAKLKSLISEQQVTEIELKSNQIVIDLTRWIGNKNLPQYLEKVKQALNDNHCLTFDYRNGNGQSSSRQVEPYQLVLKESHWYLQAFCLIKQDFRIFKLSRILQLDVLPTPFTLRPFAAKPLNGSCWADPNLITIKILLDKSLTAQMLEYYDEKSIEPYNEQQILVNLPFLADEQGYNMLLSFGDKCECLEPAEVRQELIQRIDKLRRIYG